MCLQFFIFFTRGPASGHLGYLCPSCTWTWVLAWPVPCAFSPVSCQNWQISHVKSLSHLLLPFKSQATTWILVFVVFLNDLLEAFFISTLEASIRSAVPKPWWISFFLCVQWFFTIFWFKHNSWLLSTPTMGPRCLLSSHYPALCPGPCDALPTI